MTRAILTWFLCLAPPLAEGRGSAPVESPQPVGRPADSAPTATPGASVAMLDASALLTKEEVAAVQGSVMTDPQSSAGRSGPLRISQFFYNSTEPNKSVSLAVAQADPDATTKRTVREFWHETFDRYAETVDPDRENSAKAKEQSSLKDKGREEDENEEAEQKERAGKRAPETIRQQGAAGEREEKEGRGKEGERKDPPQRIEGLGDGAYWMNNPVGGILYVLKGDKFIRISVGGPDKQEVKLDKSKALAEKALKHL